MAFINAVTCQCRKLEASILKLELFIGEAYEMFEVALNERQASRRQKKTKKRDKWKQTTLDGKLIQPKNEHWLDDLFEPTTMLEFEHIETLKKCREKYRNRSNLELWKPQQEHKCYEPSQPVEKEPVEMLINTKFAKSDMELPPYQYECIQLFERIESALLTNKKRTNNFDELLKAAQGNFARRLTQSDFLKIWALVPDFYTVESSGYILIIERTKDSFEWRRERFIEIVKERILTH